MGISLTVAVLVVRFVIGMVGLIIAYFVCPPAYDYMLATNVDPNVAAGLTVSVAALILGAFGLVAVKADIGKS